MQGSLKVFEQTVAFLKFPNSIRISSGHAKRNVLVDFENDNETPIINVM